jgi:hypothetical protein
MTKQTDPYLESRVLDSRTQGLPFPIHPLRYLADQFLLFPFNRWLCRAGRDEPGPAQDLFQLSLETLVIFRYPKV